MNAHFIKPVKLTNRAIKDLNKVKSFNKDLFGEEKAQIFIDEIFQKISILESRNVDLKKIGSIDESFSHLKNIYRKLLHRYYKITYREGLNKIYVIRVFDTRQNPSKNR